MKEIITNKPLNGIPIYTTLEKKKVLFHDTKKVLFFEKTSRNNTLFNIPTFSSDEKEYRENASFMKHFIEEENLEPFYRAITYFKIFKCVNSSLKPVYEEQIRTFYSYYHEFTSDEIALILKECFKEGLVAHMLAFEEIQNLKRKHGVIFEPILLDVSSTLDREIKKYIKK